MGKPQKLIRHKIVPLLKEGEWTTITDVEKINELLFLKAVEELEEIKASNYDDIKELADLLHVVITLARNNGFSREELFRAETEKENDKGYLSNVVLTNLNPNNPSNAIYFKNNQQ